MCVCVYFFACARPQDNGLVLAGLSAEQRVLLLQIVLKCADLGHVSRDFDVHTK